jgi:PKD repeat protein
MLLDGPAMLADAVAGFTLSVASEPSGAAIILDGNDTGVTTPAEIGDVSVSVHNVTVALDGYLPGINETVEGTAGGEEELSIEPSFSADPTSGTVPLAVQFADESAGTPVEWFWDFVMGVCRQTRTRSTLTRTPGPTPYT